MRALEELKEFEDRKPRLEGAGMRREIRFPKPAEEPRPAAGDPTSTAVESSRLQRPDRRRAVAVREGFNDQIPELGRRAASSRRERGFAARSELREEGSVPFWADGRRALTNRAICRISIRLLSR
jgi:hypothetical protein